MRRYPPVNPILLFVLLGMLLLTTSCDGDEADSQSDGDTPSDGDLADLSYPIVDTGQSSCYNDLTAISCPHVGDAFFGQDAQYDGFAPRYTDNDDGTISDNITGLMWVKDAGAKVQYDDAIAAADDFSLAGYDDWRVPTIKELYSLILFSGVDIDPTGTEASQPFLDDDTFVFAYGDVTAGERIIDSQWVTTSIYTDSVMEGQECFFGVNFADGRIKCYPTMDRNVGGYFVRYVRGGNSYGANDFMDNDDGTVSDNATGLMWMQADSGNTMNWQDALLYCESLQFAGYDDWKLPNAKQLQSLVDYSRSPGTTHSAAIDPLFECTGITNEADQADFGCYWTGTTHVNQQGGEDAVYVAFGRAMGYMNDTWMDVHGAGAQRSDPKSGDPSEFELGMGPQGDARRVYNFVRCVRDDSDFNDNPADDTTTDGDLPADGDAPDGDEVIACNDVAPGMPCCGDGVCDGPETQTNCALDCDSSTDGDLPGDGDTPENPVVCTQQADCDVPGVCPQGAAKGCICSQTPEGQLCIPACDKDADCPQDFPQLLVCDTEVGTCVPQDQQPM